MEGLGSHFLSICFNRQLGFISCLSFANAIQSRRWVYQDPRPYLSISFIEGRQERNMLLSFIVSTRQGWDWFQHISIWILVSTLNPSCALLLPFHCEISHISSVLHCLYNFYSERTVRLSTENLQTASTWRLVSSSPPLTPGSQGARLLAGPPGCCFYLGFSSSPLLANLSAIITQ